jgi:outer membrane beta-barrel protein
MTRTSRHTPPLLAGVAILAVAALVAAPRGAAADNRADAFEGKVDPVSGQLYTKTGRFELTPLVGFSVNDAFFTKIQVGAKLGYHFSEWLSVNALYQTSISTSATGSTTVCPANEACAPATEDQLRQLPGYVESIAGGEVYFTPVYAKLNLFAERVAHLDMSILLGADWITYRKVLSSAEAAAGVVPGSEGTIGGHIGLGMRIFFSQAVALRVEFKDYLYVASVPPDVLENGSTTSLQNQLMVELGVSVFFPFHNRTNP